MFHKGDPVKNFEVYLNNKNVQLDEHSPVVIDVISYFLAIDPGIAVEIGEYIGLVNKSIGYIITFLFFVKNIIEEPEYFVTFIHNMQDKGDQFFLDELKYDKLFKHKKFEDLDPCTLFCAFVNRDLYYDICCFDFESKFMRKSLIEDIEDNYNSDFSLKNNDINKFYYCPDKIEFEKILNIDPRFIYKYIYSTKNLKLAQGEYSNILITSPYHYYYFFYRETPEIFKILENMNLKNCINYAEIYKIPVENINISPFKKYYCKDKFKFDFKFIEGIDYDDKYEYLYKNYIIYNYLTTYISLNFNYDTDENVLYIDDKELIIPVTDHCAINNSVLNIDNIIEKHLNSSPGNLFIYDFDNTLGIERSELIDNGIEIEKLSVPFCESIESKDEDIFPIFSIEKLSKASKYNKPIILTKRFFGYTDDIEMYLTKFNVDAYILPMRSFRGKIDKYTKLEVIDAIWEYIPNKLGWSKDTIIDSIDFADDDYENFVDFDKSLKERKVDITLYPVNLMNEYFSKYIEKYYDDDFKFPFSN